MFGLEASVMLPIQHGLSMHAGRPLFPEDMRIALEQVAGRSVLVTTPVHLRACVMAGVKLPPMEMILSATSPLPRELAREAETRFDAPVNEIFGFAEAGSGVAEDGGHRGLAYVGRRHIDGRGSDLVSGSRVSFAARPVS